MSRARLLAALRTWPAWLAVGGMAVVVLLAVAVSNDMTDPFDRAVIDVVRADVLRSLLSPLRWITELGSTGAVTVVALVTLLVGILIGPWRHGLAGALTIAVASLANQGVKAFIARQRPDLFEPIVVEHGFSFPSGHAVLSMVAYGVLTVLITRSRLSRRARQVVVAALGLLILLIGLSRVWLGVHYPTDVVAGWTAGAVIVLLFARLTRGVSLEPAAGAVDADPAASRSDPPARGSDAPRH
ncbi:MAG: phosphatase PAP2 family protein [Candidatus Limnocylindria bacterium]